MDYLNGKEPIPADGCPYWEYWAKKPKTFVCDVPVESDYCRDVCSWNPNNENGVTCLMQRQKEREMGKR